MKTDKNGQVTLLDGKGKELKVHSVDAFELLSQENSDYTLKPEAAPAEVAKAAGPSFDYAIKKRNKKTQKPEGRALKVCDEKEQATAWLKKKGFNVAEYAIEERLRK